MKCLVCHKEYSGVECPRCGFPEIVFLENYEEGIKKIEPEIRAHRKRFLENVSLGVVVYRWKDEAGVVVVDREERIPFGNAAELCGQETWLERKFARIPEEQEIGVLCSILCKEKESQVSVTIPNLMEAELQQVGIRLTEDCKFQLLLRNDAGACSASGEMELFL
ncbi:MAG: hypothetical protein IKT58_00955 [Oscillospiraceae bacterium]|nr:hypothetical protein [Oscillospiraceae bacterium]